ncbi:MAG TPA: hypothetical protein VFA85_01105 [Terriglobales bacterium]|nr:hypothetical protein [Terriglobales bacterium]
MNLVTTSGVRSTWKTRADISLQILGGAGLQACILMTNFLAAEVLRPKYLSGQY